MALNAICALHQTSCVALQPLDDGIAHTSVRSRAERIDSTITF
jgi:hypothetical protein